MRGLAVKVFSTMKPSVPTLLKNKLDKPIAFRENGTVWQFCQLLQGRFFFRGFAPM